MKPEDITDRPVPPWELPDAFRRDGVPHRAGWLYGLANAAYGACSLALLLSLPTLLAAVAGDVHGPDAMVFAAVAALLALPALLLGGLALTLARRDRGLMLRGLMDPAGQDRTAIAAKMGRDAVVFSLVVDGAAVALLLLALCRGQP
jgi:hypothetical protein